MAIGLLYGLALLSMCVCGGFGSNDSLPMMQPFPMDGPYRTDVIMGVGHLKSDSVVPLVLCTVYFRAMAGHRYNTTGPSGQCQLC